MLRLDQLLLLAAVAPILSGSLGIDKEIALEYPSDPGAELYWAPHVKIKGGGAHRALEYEINMSALEHLACAEEGGAIEVVIIQHLPSDAFFDPYELENVLHAQGSLSFRLFGPVDLELPATVCHPTALALTIGTSSAAGSNKVDSSGSLLIQLPVHAKYPAPVVLSDKSAPIVGLGSLLAFAKSGTVIVDIALPTTLVRCSRTPSSSPPATDKTQAHMSTSSTSTEPQNRTWQALRPSYVGDWRGSGSRSGGGGGSRSGSGDGRGSGSGEEDMFKPMKWEMAAGDTKHAPVVAWGTLIVTWAAGLYIAWQIWLLPKSDHSKTE